MGSPNWIIISSFVSFFHFHATFFIIFNILLFMVGLGYVQYNGARNNLRILCILYSWSGTYAYWGQNNRSVVDTPQKLLTLNFWPPLWQVYFNGRSGVILFVVVLIDVVGKVKDRQGKTHVRGDGCWVFLFLSPPYGL